MSSLRPSLNFNRAPVTPLDDFALFHAAHQFVHHDFFGTEAVAAVYQGYGIGDVGQVECFFHGGVAAADNGYVLFFIEEAVAGGAGGHAASGEGFFARQAEVFGRCAGGDDECVAGVFARITDEFERALLQLRGVNVVENDFRAEAFGVGEEARHQFGALHAVGIGRPVVHFRGSHELAALLQTGDDDGIEVGAGGINGGGVTCGAGTEDDEFVVLAAHGLFLAVSRDAVQCFSDGLIC